MTYQHRIRQENKRRIISTLADSDLTFTELVEETGLSRGVVNSHLKVLEEKGQIRREYKNSRILIKVNEERISSDLKEMFLSQLSKYVDEETLSHGRRFFDKEVIFLSTRLLFHLLVRLLSLNVKKGGYEGKVESTNWFLPREMLEEFWSPRSHTAFKDDEEGLEDLVPQHLRDKSGVIWGLKELTPITFDITARFYEWEKRMHYNSEGYITATSNIPSEVVEKFEEAIEWWNSNIRVELRGGCIIEHLLGTCYSVLLDNQELGKRDMRISTAPRHWILTERGKEENSEFKEC